MNVIYEQQMIEDFRQQLLSGKYSEDTLVDLYNKNLLNESQIRVIEELAPILGGLKNVGKQIAGNIGNGLAQARTQGLDKAAQGWKQKAKEAFNQGKQETTHNNNSARIAKQWQNIESTVSRSKLFEQMDAFRKSFQGTDNYVDKSLGYLYSSFLDLQHYLSKKYPELKIQTNKDYVPEWKKQQQQQQKAIDAQAGVAKTQQNKKYRQDVAQNPDTRNTLGNRIRQA